MREILYICIGGAVAMMLVGCGSRSKVKDRSEACELFEAVTALTKSYTSKIAAAPDSASWAMMCEEYEDSLDKVNFSFSPDTDLLLTEGQNDTITMLIEDYVRVREERIHALLHPEPADSIKLQLEFMKVE